MSGSSRGAVRAPARSAVSFGQTASSAEATETVRVLLLGPARGAVSGVATHLNQLFESNLSRRFHLTQFRVGSEGRAERRGSTLWRLLAAPLAFTARVGRARPRIVHINTSLEPKSYWRDLVFLAIAKVCGCRVVYQVHGGSLPADFFASVPPLATLLRRSLLLADRVVLLARSEMDAYARFAPDARLVHIPNAIVPVEVDLRSERYDAHRPLEVVYIGRLAADKGVFEVVAAVKLLRDRGIAARLTIAGSGPAQEQLRRLIESQRLGVLAHLVGAVFGEAKQRLWRQAHVLAFPTYHREGLPYALLEAMASGTVPVVTPVGAIPDVAQDEVHALFVPPRDPQALADALQRLASDRLLLERLARAAHARVVEGFSVARMTEEFALLYSSLAV